MLIDIMKSGTVPGAYATAVQTARTLDVEEEWRRGGYKVAETPEPRRRSTLRVVREWLFSPFSRGSKKTDA